MKPPRACELCKEEAAVHCEADAAFLCWACDARVHGANFLVARHVRRVACSGCWSLDAGRTVSGAGSPPFLCFCPSCDADGVDRPRSPASSSASSSCISSAESTAAAVAKAGAAAAGVRRGRRRRRAEAVMVNWIRRMGLRGGTRCVVMAERVLGACSRTIGSLPFRVCLAAALWYAVKVCEEEAGRGGRTCGRMLRRLEACSGVPAKLIVVAESRLARLTRRAQAGPAEEGWAECS